jgi:hypothetical protein
MTAIDWLINELRPTICLQQKYVDEIKELAKAKEKQQIIDAYETGVTETLARCNYDKGTDYYDETFNQPKQ